MNKHLIIGILCLLSAISFAALIIAASGRPMTFGTVDTRLIISEEAKRLAKQDPNAHTSPLKMRAIADRIEGQIEYWGKARKLTLLQKQAVLSGTLPDYTQMIVKALETEKEKSLP